MRRDRGGVRHPAPRALSTTLWHPAHKTPPFLFERDTPRCTRPVCMTCCFSALPARCWAAWRPIRPAADPLALEHERHVGAHVVGRCREWEMRRIVENCGAVASPYPIARGGSMFSETNRPTKPRGAAKRVTKTDAVAALRRLRAAAESGDVAANLALIQLAEGRPLERFTNG